MRAAPAQTSIAAGEVSPLVYGRPDFTRFTTGARKCRSLVPQVQGPLIAMPGTRFVGETNANDRARLVPFVFSQDDHYTLEFTANRMRVWRDLALVEREPGIPFEMATPFDDALVAVLQYSKSKDVLFLCDGQNPPQRLSRRDHDDWIIEPIPFVNGPFRIGNTDEAITLSASGESGTVTLTATGGDVFEAGHVGGFFRLVQIDQPVPALEGDEDIIVGDRRANDGKVYEAVTEGKARTGPTHESGTVSGESGEPAWKFLHDDSGILRITAVINATTATAEVIGTLPAGVVAPQETYRHAEGAWSTKNGWPRAITRHQQRLIFGGTPVDPEYIWATATGSFVEFRPSTDDDGSFSYRVDVENGDLGIIEFLSSSGRRLTIGGREAVAVSVTARDQVFSLRSVSFDLAINRGVARARAVTADNQPVFIPAQGRSVTGIAYDLNEDRDQGLPLDKAASHILSPGVAEIVWQYAPWPVLWARTTDGDLVGLTIDKAESVTGFCRATIGGTLESIAILPDGKGEQTLWMVVRRDVGGRLIRAVEVMQPPFGLFTEEGDAQMEDAWQVLSGLRYTGDAAGTFSGLDHLEGAAVTIWTIHGNYPATVENGNATLPNGLTARQATIGLPFPDAQFVSLDIAAPSRDGDTTGRVKRISHVGVRLKDTFEGTIRVSSRKDGEWEHGDWEPLHEYARPFGDARLFDGIVRVPVRASHGSETMVALRPNPGAPMTILGITPLLDTAE